MNFIKSILLKCRVNGINSHRDREPVPIPMKDCLLSLLNQAYRLGSITKCWEQSSLVAIPRKGDLADPNNYRGISLMSTVLKVLAIIMSKRLNKSLDSRNFFTIEQAGFRKREASVTQAASMIEIL